MWQRVQGIGEAFGLGRGGVAPGPLGRFDTEWVPPEQRAEYYRAMLGGLVCAATPHLAAGGEADEPLRVVARNGRLGDLLHVRYAATAHRIERGATDVRRAQTGCYYVLRPLAGHAVAVGVGGRTLRLEPGDCLLGDSDAPLTIHEGPPLAFGLYLAPKRLVDPWAGEGAERLRPGLLLGARSAAAAMLNAALDAAPGVGDHAQARTALGIAAVVARLMAVAADEAAARAEPVRDALRAARQARILAHLDAHFADPALSPGDVALALGVSLRSLHAVLEPTGRSFSEHLAGRRLAEARRLLETEAGRGIADVAFACGFNDLSTFYRGFRRAYAAAPGEVRPPA